MRWSTAILLNHYSEVCGIPFGIVGVVCVSWCDDASAQLVLLVWYVSAGVTVHQSHLVLLMWYVSAGVTAGQVVLLLVATVCTVPTTVSDR